jgi:hypothetical protein
LQKLDFGSDAIADAISALMPHVRLKRLPTGMSHDGLDSDHRLLCHCDCFALILQPTPDPSKPRASGRTRRPPASSVRDAEKVSVECHVDQSAWQEQPGSTDACDLAGGH